MLKLIVGLGNPGPQYEKTRHNAGFWFLERLAVDLGGIWSHDAKFQGELSNVSIEGERIILLKPATFMNRSGQAVGSLARYFKIRPEEILVVHDELDFEAGKIKLKTGGGHAGHNGLKDIISHLGSREFCRLRIGIGVPPGNQSVSDYVLSGPSKEDKGKIDSAIQTVYDVLGLLVVGNVNKAMNQLHG